MKSASLPAVRVSPEIRKAAEDVLQNGETLSGFVEEAVRRSVAFRQEQQAFLARGLASAASAKQSGRYVSAADVLGKLDQRLSAALEKKNSL